MINVIKRGLLGFLLLLPFSQAFAHFSVVPHIDHLNLGVDFLLYVLLPAFVAAMLFLSIRLMKSFE